MKSILKLIVFLPMLYSCGIIHDQKVFEHRQQLLNDTRTPSHIRSAIQTKRIVTGMTKDQVIASWGLPCELCYGTRRSSNGDVWEYNDMGQFAPGLGTFLYFDNAGILKHWSSK